MRYLIVFITFLLSVTLYGQNDYSMSFDGVDDYVDLNILQNQFNSNDGFTFSTWFKSNWIAGGPLWGNTIFSITDVGFQDENVLRVGVTYNGDLNCQFNTASNPGPLGGGGAVVQANNLNDNQWHYMSIVRSPGAGQTNLDLYEALG